MLVQVYWDHLINILRYLFRKMTRRNEIKTKFSTAQGYFQTEANMKTASFWKYASNTCQVFYSAFHQKFIEKGLRNSSFRSTTDERKPEAWIMKVLLKNDSNPLLSATFLQLFLHYILRTQSLIVRLFITIPGTIVLHISFNGLLQGKNHYSNGRKILHVDVWRKERIRAKPLKWFSLIENK